jgi:hypothetical protein
MEHPPIVHSIIHASMHERDPLTSASWAGAIAQALRFSA